MVAPLEPKLRKTAFQTLRNHLPPNLGEKARESIAPQTYSLYQANADLARHDREVAQFHGPQLPHAKVFGFLSETNFLKMTDADCACSCLTAFSGRIFIPPPDDAGHG